MATLPSKDVLGADLITQGEYKLAIEQFRNAVASGTLESVTLNFDTDADITLTDDQNNYRVYTLTDTETNLTQARNVIVNSEVRHLAVYNDSGYTQTIKTSAGTGIDIADGEYSLTLYNDGTNVIDITSNKLSELLDDTSPQLGGALDTNSHIVQFSKGSDIASATALTLGTDGNYFDVTGTTTITSINTTGNIGTVIKLHFDDALTLTHHATDLILPGGANITTASGDEAEFVEYASGDFRCTSYSKANGEAVIDGGREVPTATEIRTGTDNEKVITPLGYNQTTLGWGQTWQDVTASRSSGVIYTNTTGKPIYVIVVPNTLSGYTIEIDSSIRSRITMVSGNYIPASFIVPNGSTYKINGSTFFCWNELR